MKELINNLEELNRKAEKGGGEESGCRKGGSGSGGEEDSRYKASGKTEKTGSDTGNRCNERQLLYQGKGTARFRLAKRFIWIF